jgi:D-glycero-alpha-D-manno-heptose-7-phosphate kinase
MIVSRTPLRMSFVGGGSDMESFYKKNGGAVVSTSINKYIYLSANKKFAPGYRLSYSKQETVQSIDDIQHQLFRECLRLFDVKDFLEISSIADIPSSGSGLGSSSSFTVGLINLLSAYQGVTLSTTSIADIACEVEIGICGSPIGKQDQFAAALGGMNKIIFNQDGTTDIEAVNCDPKHIKTFNDSIIVFHTGQSRDANRILASQNLEMAKLDKQKIVSEMVSLCDPFIEQVKLGDVEGIGRLLDYGWRLKKSVLNSISNSDIDKNYALAKAAGAIGGKLLGAGQQGFLVFCAHPNNHLAIEKALSGLKRLPVRFESQGTRIFSLGN